ncbi:bifunctional DNA primase/polymerase [Streptomyces sp. NPDC101227]|uniref:bifunctional DNA primase/polymerase n=1 Tax=Streptomyces sp. NPDC101227 TaxID=3366136 RepID=UPI003830D5FC
MTHDRNTHLLRAALAAAERGWHVFPLWPGDKRPALHGEKCCPRTGDCANGHLKWEQRATLDPDRIERCWAHGPYNVGIACGPSNLVVVDLDMPKSPDETPPEEWALPGITDGAGVLATLCERHGQPYPDDTHTVRSWRSGTHLYFAAPEGEALRNTAGDSGKGLGWKIDTRAAGGLVVAAGSVFGGRPYETVHQAPVASLPGWLAARLRPAPLPEQQPVTIALAADRRGRWLQAAVDGELARVTGSGGGQHNNALYIASVALGQLVKGGELAEAEVTGWLLSAAINVGQGEREALRTIASGLKAGAARPRTVAA